MNPELFLLPKDIHRPKKLIESAITQKEFYYLNAERIGPRIQQSLQHQLFPNAGWQGESCAQLLSTMEYEKAFENRNVKDKKQKFFIDQVNDWLNEILGGIRVSAKSNPNTLSAQVLLENTYTSSEPTLSTNLGFGVSYLLPIIANCLIAKEGSFVIIENPEAHLHPGAQSKLGSFIAKVASSGVKIILETHSDHIISGIQIATAENEIQPEDVCINFFNEVDNIQPVVETITISANGELSNWPKGFFDQTQLDYAHLFNLRRNV